MIDINNTDDQLHSSSDACEAIRTRFPEYVTELALKRIPGQEYRDVTTHIASCRKCREEVDELAQMMIATYTNQITPAETYPALDHSFLPVESPLARPWLLDASNRLVITFSDALLQTMRRPAVMGAMRSHPAQEHELVYRYIQEPGSVNNLEVTIEVFRKNSAQTTGRINIGVHVPSRSPFEQAGSHVTLRANQLVWRGETDELGSIDFHAFPLELLPRLRVEIEPGGGA
jgi:hypothetical protein